MLSIGEDCELQGHTAGKRQRWSTNRAPNTGFSVDFSPTCARSSGCQRSGVRFSRSLEPFLSKWVRLLHWEEEDRRRYKYFLTLTVVSRTSN